MEQMAWKWVGNGLEIGFLSQLLENGSKWQSNGNKGIYNSGIFFLNFTIPCEINKSFKSRGSALRLLENIFVFLSIPT